MLCQRCRRASDEIRPCLGGSTSAVRAQVACSKSLSAVPRSRPCRVSTTTMMLRAKRPQGVALSQPRAARYCCRITSSQWSAPSGRGHRGPKGVGLPSVSRFPSLLSSAGPAPLKARSMYSQRKAVEYQQSIPQPWGKAASRLRRASNERQPPDRTPHPSRSKENIRSCCAAPAHNAGRDDGRTPMADPQPRTTMHRPTGAVI